jgi:hypothetical protein
MSYRVVKTIGFERRAKHLKKKYRSLSLDLLQLIDELETTPTLGVPLGKDVYKIRLAIRSKGKGKSGSARVITIVKVVNEVVYLADIYDKSEVDDITEKEIENLIKRSVV